MNKAMVYDPRGIVDAAPQALSKRVGRLAGLRLGILDNTKWNANRLLKKTAAQLQEQYPFAAVNYYRKESFSKMAGEALLQRIAEENDIAMTAIGD
jgi:hypothetical protein